MTETVMTFDNLTKTYDETVVLAGINAEVHRGDVIGLVGLNGAGKTTLLEVGLGFGEASGGCAKVFGIPSTKIATMDTKARIGFVPQQDEMIDVLPGKRYLNLLATFYDHWNRDLVQRLCDEWDIPTDRSILKMSLGQRQKLSIVSALGHEPDLIILDEPVASLDPVARRQFLRELVSITDDRDCAIVFSTHIVSDLERVASRVWFLKDGLITIDEPLDTLKERIARVYVPASVQLPAKFEDDLIHIRTEQTGQQLMLRHWSNERHQELEQIIGVKLDPEWWLSLEDMFLEIHV